MVGFLVRTASTDPFPEVACRGNSMISVELNFCSVPICAVVSRVDRGAQRIR